MTEQKKLKWRLLSWLFRTVGRTSGGIALGYHYGFDSGEMLDYVYENRVRGRWLVGRVIDRIYLNAIGWRAIRTRKELLKQLMLRELESHRVADQPAVLLDVASGPGRYLLEVCQMLKDKGQDQELTVICRDLDSKGLELGQQRAQRLGFTDIHWEVGDACDAASLATVQSHPDIVVVSGLYELLDEDLIRASMQGIAEIVRPGGRLIFTTQVRHPQLELIANVLVNREGKPWIMTCRSAETMEGWAQDAGFTVVDSQLEPLGLFAVTVTEKLD